MDAVRVTVRPHPFREERRTVEVPAGRSVAELLQLAGLEPEYAGPAHIDGVPVPREEWTTRRPDPGQTVTARAVPRGAATNKDGWPRVLLAIVTVGTSEIWRQVYKRSGIVLNSMFWSPETPSVDGLGNSQDRQLRPFITGTRNEMRPNGVIPQMFGYRVRYRPPYAARPYSSWRGNKQHFHCLFSFGYGPLRVHDDSHKLGDTPVAAFGLKLLAPTTTPDQDKEANLQVREGWNDDPDIAYYLDQTAEQQLNVELRHKDAAGNRAEWSYRRTEAAIERIGVEVYFPEGLIEYSGNSTKKLEVEIEVEYAPAGTDPLTGRWTKATGRDDAGKTNKYDGIAVKDDRRSPFGVGIDWTVSPTQTSPAGPAGQYDVRMRRKTGDRNKLEQMDRSIWSVLREYRLGDPVNVSGLCTVAMDIQATGNLSGELDSYNAEVSWMGTYYDGASWVTPTKTSTPTLATSAQPAAHFRAILQGAANKGAVADSRLDLTTLAAWAVACESAGLHFNGPFDTPGVVFDRLQTVAAMGRASFTMREGKYSVVQDLAEPGTAVQHFTPRNYHNFESQIVYQDPVHALFVEYVDNTKEDVLGRIVVYDDGYNADGSGGDTAATVFETLTLLYCRDKDEAWKHGRRALFERRLRRERYTIDVDVENVIANRGDPVVLAIEAIDEIAGWGRVVSVTQSAGAAVSVATDELIAINSAAAYTMRFRKSDGSSLNRIVNTPGTSGDYDTFTFTISIPSGDPQPVAGDLFLMRKGTQTYRRCIVTQIEHRSDLVARLTLVDEATDVYTADTTESSTATTSTTNSGPRAGSRTEGAVRITSRPGSGTTPGIRVTVTLGTAGRVAGSTP